MDKLTQQLLDCYQRNFPLTSRPYRDMADYLSTLGDEVSEEQVITQIRTLKRRGTITRLGPVFDHKRAGASLLAAVKANPDKAEYIAQIINSYPEVNHNYGREDEYNIWFVVTAPNQEHLNDVLLRLENEIELPILRLPMEQAYHIDLGFHICLKNSEDKKPLYAHKLSQSVRIESLHNTIEQDYKLQSQGGRSAHFRSDSQPLTEDKQSQLRRIVQDGLPLVSEPFQALAKQLGTSEGRVLSTFENWLDSGLVKRLGLIANHHRVGYTSNAMVVWDIPDNQVDGIGEAFKESGLVTLCYRRSRHAPEWKFNLYCMVHSRDRSHVYEVVEQLTKICGLQDIEKKILFSTRQYKQTGGRYTHHAANDQGLESRSKMSGSQVVARRAI